MEQNYIFEFTMEAKKEKKNQEILEVFSSVDHRTFSGDFSHLGYNTEGCV